MRLGGLVLKKKILVIGSLNMDFMIAAKRFPNLGETVTDATWQQFPGGKGANQAAAAAKLLGSVSFIGALGDDNLGKSLLQSLIKAGIHTVAVKKVAAPTGAAVVMVDENGDNRIIVIPGANRQLTPEMIENDQHLFKEASVLLIQLEIPLPTVIKAIELARQFKLKVILDPAPYRELPLSILEGLDYIIPNEGELKSLCPHLQTEKERANYLLNLGVQTVIITKGAEGAFVYRLDAQQKIEPFKIKAVDTTAAGDAFAGALALGLTMERSEDKILTMASAAGALTATKKGAQSSLPSRDELELFLKQQLSK